MNFMINVATLIKVIPGLFVEFLDSNYRYFKKSFQLTQACY